MSNGKLRRAFRQRRTALYAAAAAIAAAAAPVLATLPSHASVTPRPAIPASAIPALRSNMLQLARFSGDAHPASIRAVLTTQAEALQAATPGDLIPGSATRRVYLVVMTGKFTVNAPVPSGAHLPTGQYLAVTINPTTWQVMDLGIGDHKPPVSIRNLGPVSDLTK